MTGQTPAGYVQTFKAAVVLGQDLKSSLGVDKCPTIQSTSSIAQAFGEISDLKQEVLIAGTLDCKFRLLFWNLIAAGTSERLVMRVGDAFYGAVYHHGSAIFLVHNHPTGSLTPSREDFELTRVVAEAGLQFGYPLIDHVIVSRKGARSLMMPATLKHPRNNTSVTTGRLLEVAEAISISVQWTCERCKTDNDNRFMSGVQNHVCKPVRCIHCNGFTWLSVYE